MRSATDLLFLQRLLVRLEHRGTVSKLRTYRRFVANSLEASCPDISEAGKVTIFTDESTPDESDDLSIFTLSNHRTLNDPKCGPRGSLSATTEHSVTPNAAQGVHYQQPQKIH